MPESSSPPGVAVAGQPVWGWGTKFLGSVRISCRKVGIGAVPDGLRIEWYVEEGSFAGPGLDGVVVPGAADWMRIRNDGVAIVDVQACLETRRGARIYAAWGGIIDLGPDGYARALRDEFMPLPPLVNTPTLVTADKQLAWLNRAQCIGVGRVDTTALLVEFDLYALQVGKRKHAE